MDSMSATTAQSTESLASPLSLHACSSWLLSAFSPWPRPPRPLSADPTSPPPPPNNWMRRKTTTPATPSPPPPTATPRPPIRPPPNPPPPRRSRTLDVSRLPPSRYLMSGRPPARVRSAPEDLRLGFGHREPDLDRAAHFRPHRRQVETQVARLEREGRRARCDPQSTARDTRIRHLQEC